MMAPMEKQVCSLEHSQKLEKLGVKQNSLFYWRKYQFCKNTDLYYIPSKEMDLMVLSGKLEYSLSAFTVAELFEIFYNEMKIDFWIYHNAGKYILQTRFFKIDDDINEENLADCLAKMLIYLIENNLIKL
jgi:hypothetical protein